MAKFLNHIWKLNLIPTIKLPAWKLIRVRIPTREYLRNIEIDINRDCLFVTSCGKYCSSYQGRCFVSEI